MMDHKSANKIEWTFCFQYAGEVEGFGGILCDPTSVYLSESALVKLLWSLPSTHLDNTLYLSSLWSDLSK